MNILQFKFEKLTDEEYEIIPTFCRMIRDMIFTDIDKYNNRLKIKKRIPYLYQVSWIKWKKQYITERDILDTIYNSLSFTEYRDNVYKIDIDTSVKIPNTRTSIDRLIRFLDYGDLKYKGIGILSTIEHKYNYKLLNDFWKMCVIENIGYTPNSKIIGVP